MNVRMSLLGRGLCVTGLCLGLSAGAVDVTINVTTTADEDGTNSARCSLREAITAVNLSEAYGGCPAGDRVYDNLIQLEAGVYALNDEVEIKNDVVIAGADTIRADEVNPLTGVKPNRVRPDNVTTGTFIQGASGQRIFLADAQLTLRDVKLQRPSSDVPVAGNGGLIYSSNSLSLFNVILEGGRVSGTSNAAGNGGAIFLARDNSGLTMADVTLRNNSASNKGGAVAMSCRIDLVSFATHNITIERSLFRANQSALGAGAIELCGSSTAAISHSTFSENMTPTATAGAITFDQQALISVGRLSLGHITAAEQTGHVLSLYGLDTVLLNSSFLGFPADGASACYPASTTVTGSDVVGDLNVFSDDSCNRLVRASGGQNPVLPGTATRATVFESGLGTFGLVDYYLPRFAMAPEVDYLIDRGPELTVCKSVDQRSTVRKSGLRCDVGAIERLQLSAEDDEADSLVLTDRLAVVDILANDSFAETVDGPTGFPDNTAEDVDPAVLVTSQVGGTCTWRYKNDADYPNMLVVATAAGALTEKDDPVVCTYVLIEKGTGIQSAPATVEAHIGNQNPLARDDRFIRPEGAESLTFNPLTNDDDDGDGIYGREGADMDNPPAWEEFYPIEILSAPTMGVVVGTGPSPSGLCPGSGSDPKTCLSPPLKYIAKNNLSPFADTFTYRVYDADGGRSNSATVTVATDVPEPGTGGGSVDLAGLLLLGLIGLRRRFKL